MDRSKVKFLVFNIIFTCLFVGIFTTSFVLMMQYGMSLVLLGMSGGYIVSYLIYGALTICCVFFLLALWIAFAKLFSGKNDKVHTAFMVLATIIFAIFLALFMYALIKAIVSLSEGYKGIEFIKQFLLMFYKLDYSRSFGDAEIIGLMVPALIYGWIFMSSVKKRNMKMSANNENVQQASSAYAPRNINMAESSDSNTAARGNGGGAEAEQSISYYKGNYPY